MRASAIGSMVSLKNRPPGTSARATAARTCSSSSCVSKYPNDDLNRLPGGDRCRQQPLRATDWEVATSAEIAVNGVGWAEVGNGVEADSADE